VPAPLESDVQAFRDKATERAVHVVEDRHLLLLDAHICRLAEMPEDVVNEVVLVGLAELVPL
jgi:hypothetical protein